MSAPAVEPADLLDLKFLPAWVKEPGATKHYDHYTPEEAPTELRSRDRVGRHKDRSFPSRERRGTASTPRVQARQTPRAAERPRQKARGVTIPIEAKIAVRRTALRSLRQSHSRERFVFSRVRTYSKMWLLRSTPARLPIRSLF